MQVGEGYKKMNKIVKVSIISLTLICLSVSFYPFVRIEASVNDVTILNLDSFTNRGEVSSDTPQITVFTPGLGCLADVWSNDNTNDFSISDGKFLGTSTNLVYDETSLIEAIRSKKPDNTVVYLATLKDQKGTISYQNKTVEESVSVLASDYSYNDLIGADSLKGLYVNKNGYNELDQLYLIPQIVNNYQFEEFQNDESSTINSYLEKGCQIKSNLTQEDVNKYIVILFQQYYENVSENNDYVYMQLEYILDNLSYDYYCLTNILPTYNLISHSKGGLTNMQYALAHPYNVNSIYTIGAPFNGSASCNICTKLS